MRILVTGGAGFIGSHIVDAYIAEGHEVVILDNFSTGNRGNVNPSATLVEGDVRDVGTVHTLFQSHQFDLVNHHAAQLDVRVSVRDPRFDAETNILGSINLFQAAVEANVRRIVFASSGGTVYGNQERFPADESHPTNPISPYGVAKLSVEKYLHYYMAEYGIRGAVLRYTNVFGPRQNPHGEAGVIAIFCDRLHAGQQPIINGAGTQTRDYVFVGDVVRANVLALQHLGEGEAGGVYNVCTDTETSVTTLFTMLNGLFDAGASEQHGPGQPGEQLRSRCSFAKVEAAWGWHPETLLHEGLRRTVEFYRTGVSSL